MAKWRKLVSKVMDHSGKILIFCSIICEIIYKGDPWLVLMTAGSLMIMLAGQIWKKQ